MVQCTLISSVSALSDMLIITLNPRIIGNLSLIPNQFCIMFKNVSSFGAVWKVDTEFNYLFPSAS